MNLYTDIENIPCQILSSNNGYSTISFTLPDVNVNAFVLLLTSLSSLFRGLGWKTKTNLDAIHERTAASKPFNDQRLLDYENAVVKTFADFIKKGEEPRAALSLTVSAVITQFEFSSFDNVKKCLTKNKLLKKTGFYKSRHKID